MTSTSLARKRQELARRIDAQLGPFDPILLEALRSVPRERFVRAGDEDRSAEDTPLPLDDEGFATVSAPHAYLLSYRLVGLAPNDTLVELGSGSGYGATLASFIVGPAGRVLTIEIDDALFTRARALTAHLGNVRVVQRDATASAELWASATAGAARSKFVCTFAIDELPRSWLDAIPEGGVLVAPVSGDPSARDQALVRVARESGSLTVTKHGAVRYVKNRSGAPI